MRSLAGAAADVAHRIDMVHFQAQRRSDRANHRRLPEGKEQLGAHHVDAAEFTQGTVIR